jgi:hypothetical protein
MPRDGRARERLRLVQQQEAEALAAVCAAQRKLEQACAKRDDALAAADAEVGKAQQSVSSAQATLIGVSGLDRAAVLLDIDSAVLRRTVGNGRRSGG